MNPNEDYIDLDGPDPEHLLVTTVMCELGHLTDEAQRCIGCLNAMQTEPGRWTFYCNECGLIAGKGYDDITGVSGFVDGKRLETGS